MTLPDTLYTMIPPKGSMLRAHAEAAVHLRRVGRAIRTTPEVRGMVNSLKRLPWWTFHIVAFAFMLWALWYGDLGWMLAAATYTLWGVWLRR